MSDSSSSLQTNEPLILTQAPWSAGLLLWVVVKTYLAGALDALSLHRAISLVYKSKKIQSVILNCFFLNGIIFLGSYFVFELMITPRIQSILQSSLSAFLCSLFSFVYYGCWLFPVCLFSFIINSAWYKDIAEQAFIHSGQKATKGDDAYSSIEKRVAAIVYSCVLGLAFLVFSFTTMWIPYIGEALYFIQLSWLYSYYCFEYRWTLRGKWSLIKRLAYFEEHYIYMLGFGTPFTLAFFFFFLFALQWYLRLALPNLNYIGGTSETTKDRKQCISFYTQTISHLSCTQYVN